MHLNEIFVVAWNRFITEEHNMLQFQRENTTTRTYNYTGIPKDENTCTCWREATVTHGQHNISSKSQVRFEAIPAKNVIMTPNNMRN